MKKDQVQKLKKLWLMRVLGVCCFSPVLLSLAKVQVYCKSKASLGFRLSNDADLGCECEGRGYLKHIHISPLTIKVFCFCFCT